MTFYNSLGRARAYSDDGIHVFLLTGEPVAYVFGDSLYSYPGKHLGWFRKGWVRDHSGRCVLFTDRATGGPPLPVKDRKPPMKVKQPLPLKARQAPPPATQPPLDAGSDLSGVQLLKP